MNKTFLEVKKILKDAQIDEAEAKARIIVREVGHLKFEDMLLDKDVENKEEVLNFAKKLALSGEPLQYMLGYSYFMGEKFIVTPDTLIPREETEFLVRCAIDKIRNLKTAPNVLEIGTGSGCIACMIAKNLPDIEVLGVDISTNALQVALENAQKLDLIRKVIFRKSDVFSSIRDGEKFDLIVSNPPYIKKDDYLKLDKTVLNFEPKSALLAGEDGLEFYIKIINEAKKYLKPSGFIAFECAQGQADDICGLFEQRGFEVCDVICDMAGIKRVVCAGVKKGVRL